MKIKELSFMISWVAFINLIINMLIVGAFKIGLDAGKLDSGYEIAGNVMLVYAVLVLIAAVIISNKMDQIEDERRNRIRRKRKELNIG